MAEAEAERRARVEVEEETMRWTHMDLDTAIDTAWTVTGRRASYSAVPSYRNTANTQTDINMNPALDLHT